MPYADPAKRREYKKNWVAANRDKARKASLKSYYKRKEEDPEKVRKYWRDYHRRDPERSRRSRLKSVYGFEGTVPDKCQACDGTSYTGPIQVDHCHRTGNIRGFLCSACNIVLGHVNDDPSRLRSLIAYLGEEEENVDTSLTA